MKNYLLLALLLGLSACAQQQRNPDYWNCVDEAAKQYNSCMINATTGEDVQSCQDQRVESAKECAQKYPPYL